MFPIQTIRDMRHGLRALRRGRAVSVLAVLAYALGIAVTTSVFSVFYGVLLKPLPYPEPDELVLVYDVQPACATCPASWAARRSSSMSSKRATAADPGSRPARWIRPSMGRRKSSSIMARITPST